MTRRSLAAPFKMAWVGVLMVAPEHRRLSRYRIPRQGLQGTRWCRVEVRGVHPSRQRRQAEVPGDPLLARSRSDGYGRARAAQGEPGRGDPAAEETFPFIVVFPDVTGPVAGRFRGWQVHCHPRRRAQERFRGCEARLPDRRVNGGRGTWSLAAAHPGRGRPSCRSAAAATRFRPPRSRISPAGASTATPTTPRHLRDDQGPDASRGPAPLSRIPGSRTQPLGPDLRHARSLRMAPASECK